MTGVWAGDATYLDLVRIDFAADYRDQCLQWLDNIWIPALIASRSASSVTRYQCINGEPRELILVGSAEAPAGEVVSTIPTGGSLIDRWTRNYETASYRQIFAQGAAFRNPQTINVISTKVLQDRAADFSSWYTDVHMPEILACPGWVCGRRFVHAGSDSVFLAMYQVSDETSPFSTDAYEEAVGWDGFEQVMVGFHGFRLYEREVSWFDGVKIDAE